MGGIELQRSLSPAVGKMLREPPAFIFDPGNFRRVVDLSIKMAGFFPWLNDEMAVRKLLGAFHSPIPQLLVFLIIPLMSLYFMGEPPKKYGFQIGNWKEGLSYAIISVGLLAPLLLWASTMESFTRYYQGRLDTGFLWMVVRYGLYMLAWEFILRGYIYFSLEEKVGTLAIWLQSVPFAVAHIGKPPAEALTCFFGGLVLGYMSYKSRSFVYAFLVHWGIYTLLLYFISIAPK